MRLLFLFLFFIAPVLANAGVSFIEVNDMEEYKQKNDFSNTVEINIQRNGENTINKCQAVLLAKDWLISAAHCFKNCDDGCAVKVMMYIGQDFDGIVTATHTPKEPAIFFITDAKGSKQQKYDIALLNITNKNGFAAIFIKKSGATSEDRKLYSAALNNLLNNNTIPPIMFFTGIKPRVLRRDLSVVSIWDGNREVFLGKGPAFFTPRYSRIYMENFGIKQGLSGSGVMANSGQLVGIVSGEQKIETNFYNSKKIKANIFFISAFDEIAKDFIKSKVPSLNFIEATQDHAGPLPPKNQRFAYAIERGAINFTPQGH